MKKSVKNGIRWLPGVLISIAVIAFISTKIDFGDLIGSIREIPLGTILLIIALTLLSIIARAIAWMKFLPKVQFSDAFFLINESYLFNNLIPRSGEIVKTILFAPPSGKSAFEVLSSVIVERALDLLLAAGMFLSTFPFISRLDSIRPIALTLLILFVIFLVICFFVALKSEWVKSQLAKVFPNTKIYQETILPLVSKIIDGFNILTDFRQFFSILVWILVSWILWTAIVYVGMITIDGRVKIWWSLFTQGVLALGIALPSAPAGLGVFEGSMVAALSVFDISAEKAFAIAVVIHLIQIVQTAILGIIGIVRQGDSIAAILGRISSSRKKS